MSYIKWSQAFWGYAAVVTFLAGPATSALAQAPVIASQSKASADLAGIHAAAERFLRVFDDLDWESFRASWASEPTVFFPFPDTPDRVAGQVAVEARLAAVLRGSAEARTGAALPALEAARAPGGALRGCGTGHVYA